MNDATVVMNIRNALKDYLITHKLKALVIGESGGIDSAICSALAEPVCKELGVKLIGRSLPILTNKIEEIDRARMIGEAFCDDFKEVDLGYMFKEFNHFVEEEEGVLDDGMRDKIRQGNIKARIRMIYLYNLAFANQGLVLSTDNLTEYMLGFSTIMGDWGDYGMIQYLWKTEVYSVATYLACEYEKNLEENKANALFAAIHAVPTDGLGITSNDLEQLGAPTYMEVDALLIQYVELGNKDAENHPVIKRHNNSHFKRNWPITIKRETLLA